MRVRSPRCVPGVMYASVPMMGFTPAALACFQKSNAPNTLPWSVIATAGIFCSAAACTSGPTRAAPSSIEYSLWTWRWTNESLRGTGLFY